MRTCALITPDKVDTMASVLARIATTFVYVCLAMFPCPTLNFFFNLELSIKEKACRTEIII